MVVELAFAIRLLFVFQHELRRIKMTIIPTTSHPVHSSQTAIVKPLQSKTACRAAADFCSQSVSNVDCFRRNRSFGMDAAPSSLPAVTPLAGVKRRLGTRPSSTASSWPPPALCGRGDVYSDDTYRAAHPLLPDWHESDKPARQDAVMTAAAEGLPSPAHFNHRRIPVRGKPRDCSPGLLPSERKLPEPAARFCRIAISKAKKNFFSLCHKDFGPDFHFSRDFLCNIFAAFTLNGTNRAANGRLGRTDPGLCRT